MIELTGGTMTVLAGEISKICAYSGADEIRKTDIDAVTEPVLDAVVFQMTDLLSAGRYDQALLKLQQLLKMQQEPLAILGAVVFTAVTWLFSSMMDRLSSGPAAKLAPVMSALGLYLAAQCFMGIGL